LGLAGAAAFGNGIAGVAYGARLWAIQAGVKGAECKFEDTVNHFATAIYTVIKQPANNRRVVLMLEVESCICRNMEQSLPIARAIREAIAANIVVCIAAGNGGGPALVGDDSLRIDPTGAIVVGATTHGFSASDNEVWICSNRAGGVTIFAPGDPEHDITCGLGGANDYTPSYGGTSGALAKVAGVAALMLQYNKNLRHADVANIFSSSPRIAFDTVGRQRVPFLDCKFALNEAAKIQ
jgi:subtilisin family serine protease